MKRTGALRPEQVVSDLPMLALFLGGSGDSFTGDLLRLMRKADPGNRARLARGFAREDTALALWELNPEPPTAEQLAAQLEFGFGQESRTNVP